MQPPRFAVVLADPRRLWVSWRARHMAMDILVLHAPTGRKGSQKRAKWWAHTADLMAAHGDQSRPLI
eukprot:10780582-Lingulodinium_polyedra.AAC.1